MEITVNGEARQVPEDLTIARLLEVMNLTGKRLAVEVNLEIVPRTSYATHPLQLGDRVEIIHAIGGG